MRERLTKWAVTLAILFGVPSALIWAFMPYLDMSHATYLTAQGDYQRALRTLSRALAFNGHLASAYTRRGFVYYKLGQLDKALSDDNRAIVLAETDWEPYNNRAVVLAEQPVPDLKHAMDDVNVALSLSSDCPGPYDTRGDVAYRLGDYARAVADFDRAIDLNRSFGQAYYHRALCYDKLNQPDKAKLDKMRAHEFGYYQETLDGVGAPLP